MHYNHQIGIQTSFVCDLVCAVVAPVDVGMMTCPPQPCASPLQKEDVLGVGFEGTLWT